MRSEYIPSRQPGDPEKRKKAPRDTKPLGFLVAHTEDAIAFVLWLQDSGLSMCDMSRLLGATKNVIRGFVVAAPQTVCSTPGCYALIPPNSKRTRCNPCIQAAKTPSPPHKHIRKPKDIKPVPELVY